MSHIYLQTKVVLNENQNYFFKIFIFIMETFFFYLVGSEKSRGWGGPFLVRLCAKIWFFFISFNNYL